MPVLLELRIRACHVRGSFPTKDNRAPAISTRALMSDPARFDYMRLAHPPVTFRQEKLRVINEGLMGIGMAWGIDGRAYFVDWIGGYPLDGKGAVWNMDVATKTDAVSKEILSLPLSSPLSKERLLQLLGHPDQRVRVNATLRLDRLGAWADLMAVALNDKRERLARIHAIWGWGMGLRHGRLASLQGATQLLGDADDEIRVQTLKVLSEGRLPPPSRLTLETEITDAIAQKMVAQLASTNPRLRMQAGITLGRLGLGRVGLVATPAPLGAFLHDAAADLKMPWLRHGFRRGREPLDRANDVVASAFLTRHRRAGRPCPWS
jgi:hypothetical protein